MKRGVLIVSALLISCAGGGAYFFRPQTPPPAAAPKPIPMRSSIEALDKAIQERFHNLTSFGMGRITRVPQHYQPGVPFRPEKPAEFAALGEAHKNKQRVAFFLCGRGVLRDVKPLTDSDIEKLKKKFPPQKVENLRREISEDLQSSLGTDISSPVLVAGYELPPEDFHYKPNLSQQEKQQRAKEEAARNALWTRALAITPTAPEIREFARKALQTTAKEKSYRGTLRDWSMEARPVRATKAACLRCHDSLGAEPRTTIYNDRRRPQHLKIGDALGVVVYVYQPLSDSNGAL